MSHCQGDPVNEQGTRARGGPAGASEDERCVQVKVERASRHTAENKRQQRDVCVWDRIRETEGLVRAALSLGTRDQI